MENLFHVLNDIDGEEDTQCTTTHSPKLVLREPPSLHYHFSMFNFWPVLKRLGYDSGHSEMAVLHGLG